MDNRRVFAFLDDALKTGQPAVLVTVIAVEGSSMREPGTHMGVAADGSFAGSLSGGCIENAVVAEALEALADKQARTVRFGSGSRYIDIKLPCGGGLDIHFLPIGSAKLVERCLQAIRTREAFSLSLSLKDNNAEFSSDWRETGCDVEAGMAWVGHRPEPRLLIVGHGAATSSLALLARQMDLTVEVLSPDPGIVRSLVEAKIETRTLAGPQDIDQLLGDRWTAIAFLFHDHDWEIALMAHALHQPHYYIGAMGGRKAHAFRREALLDQGCNESAIATIRAPIGLFHSSRDPDTLALSTLAQIIECYHLHSFDDG